MAGSQGRAVEATPKPAACVAFRVCRARETQLRLNADGRRGGMPVLPAVVVIS
ncbi:hypothetical protein CPCC7001_2477 [Cyanobium sp. PCC 7001]|nr:hypothetical protein CPCC7001_2477 [Cyanobium sp. PCC 7001]